MKLLFSTLLVAAAAIQQISAAIPAGTYIIQNEMYKPQVLASTGSPPELKSFRPEETFAPKLIKWDIKPYEGGDGIWVSIFNQESQKYLSVANNQPVFDIVPHQWRFSIRSSRTFAICDGSKEGCLSLKDKDGGTVTLEAHSSRLDSSWSFEYVPEDS